MAKVAARRASGDSQRSNQAAGAVSLSDQLKKMLRHPLIILTAVILGAILGALASNFSTPKYQATSTVLATPVSPDPNALASNQLTLKIDTEAGVAASREVAEEAAQEIDVNDQGLVSRLVHNVEVAPHSGTEVMDITATADNPEDAALYANSIAKAYLKVRTEAAQERVDAAAKEAQKELDNLPKDSSDQVKATLTEKLAQIQLTNTKAGRVISEAKAPHASQNLGMLKTALVGACLGLLIGAVLAWIADSRARKLAHADRAEEVVQGPVSHIRRGSEVEDTRRALMALGAPVGHVSSEDRRGVIIYSPTPQLAEQYASIVGESVSQENVHFTDSNSTVLSNEPTFQAVANQPTVVVASHEAGFSEVLSAAENLGAALIVVDSSTDSAQLREFAQFAARTSHADIEYVYLAS